MSYLALLCCQDEKTARTITQVLSELDFQVDLCSETFAAVKKLTTQAFEAVVVDCQNEENASLLLKTARNSVFNAASLMVALVEGQTGVAAAFRIGANLVLTKPIAIEQARGTLRVARGLLRKNAGPGAGATAAPSAAPAADRSTTTSVPSVPTFVPTAAKPAPAPIVVPTPSRLPAAAAATPTPARPIPSSIPTAVSSPHLSSKTVVPQRTPVPPSALRAVAASGNLESEAERQPAPDAASAGLLEALDFKTFEAAPARSFGLSASESVSVLETTPGAHEAVRSVLAPKAPISSQDFGGFGAAAAPARELPKAAPVLSAEVADLFDAPVFGQSNGRQATPATSPLESGLHGTAQEDELDLSGAPAASRSRAPLMAIVVLLALVSAAYFGWTQLHKPVASTRPTAGPLQPPPPDFDDATPAAPAPSQAAPAAAAPVADTPAESVNRFSRQSKIAANQGSNQVAPDQVTTPIAIAPSRAVSAPASAQARTPLQVKTELQRSVAVPQAAAADTAEAPSIANLGASTKPDLLNAIAHSATALPAAPSTQRISQGVSDGLLLKRVTPIYPQQAMQMHTQGKVALQATIARDGSVRNVKVVSGPGILARAATDAVRQWKYKPYTLNGEPIEVQTEININFVPPR
jgi:protein TonB